MTEVRGLVLTPDGEIEEKLFPPTGHDLLKALYGAINCDAVQAVLLGHGAHVGTMYLDEEGKVEQQLAMPNEYATIVVSGVNHVVHEVYTGTAVFLGPPDSEGNDTSLSELAATYIRGLVAALKRTDAVREFRNGGSDA
ncbi:DUF3846 domain-containing protein [Amycolatopsis minnesotensis]|uniref:DUF3846 domain-containing protein n=1 Tax=Amycolatopsis minnesotensis TaxID=337894 RepID=A0ABN2R127_9PSEU